ncbi:MAG: ATP-grasp domain-containing protein [Bacilli bacterium]
MKSGSSRDALRTAQEMGYVTCLLTKNTEHIKKQSEFPEVSLMYYVDLDYPPEVRNAIMTLKAQNHAIYAIVSFVDPYCGLAAQLSEENRLESFTASALYKMANKLVTREVLEDTPYNPRYLVVNAKNREQTEKKAEAMLPLVLKYVESNGSRDVFLCKTKEDYRRFLNRLLRNYPRGNVLAEEFIDGRQVIVEVLATNGTINIIAIIEQEIMINRNHFIVTGYNLVTKDETENYRKLKADVKKIIEKFGLVNGPCHLEMRCLNGEWKVIEMNPRISGGGMNQLLSIGLGINLVKETLNLALDEKVTLEPKYRIPTFAQYLTVKRGGVLARITGKNQVSQSPGVRFVFIKPRRGKQLYPPINLGNRYAYVIATGETGEEAKTNAQKALEKLKFHYY